MNTDYIAALIGIGGTLVGTVLGFFLTIIYDDIREERKLNSELQSAINKALFVDVIYMLPAALNELRELAITNAQACRKYKGLPEFYANWLTHPAIQLGREFIGLYPPEQVEKLKKELMNIKL